jgi:TMEM164 family
MSLQQQYTLSLIPDILHDYIFSGGILKGGSWGGKQCRETISLEAHSIEMIAWFLVCFIIHRLCQYQRHYKDMLKNAEIILKDHERSQSSRALDVVFGVLHFGIWLLVLYYKVTLHSLINLCQPCHIALLVQGLGVVVGGSQGAVIGIISLPLVVGPIGALAVPALDGLDQPYEKLFFFIQHYLLLVTPLFLLLRNNFCSYKLVTFRSLVFANWGILVLHWFMFAVRENRLFLFLILYSITRNTRFIVVSFSV